MSEETRRSAMKWAFRALELFVNSTVLMLSYYGSLFFMNAL